MIPAFGRATRCYCIEQEINQYSTITCKVDNLRSTSKADKENNRKEKNPVDNLT